jgi:DNA invertase Pin-like site-specific DNA recombinase
VKRRASDPTLAVAYLRVSTEDQNNGPEAQRHSIEAWAARAGVKVISWHEDRLSGGTPAEDRPAFLAALAELRASGAGVFLAAKRDRLARGVLVAATAERLIADAGGRIITADGVTSDDSPEGQLMRGIMDLFAQYERAVIRARTKAAMAVKARRGEHTGGAAPYGHAVSRATESATLVQIEEEQMVIGMIRNLNRQGFGAARIARRLNKAGVPCRGSAWHPMTVRRVLGRVTRATENLRPALGSHDDAHGAFPG